MPRRRLLAAHRRHGGRAWPRWWPSTRSPTTSALRWSDQAKALLGADLAMISRRRHSRRLRGAARLRSAGGAGPGRGARSPASPRWPTCPHQRRPAGASGRGRAGLSRSTARSRPARPARGPPCRTRRALVEPALLTALDAHLGDTLSVGEASFRIVGTVDNYSRRCRHPLRVRPPGVHSRRLPGRDPAAQVRLARRSTRAFVRLPAGEDAATVAKRIPQADVGRAGTASARWRKTRTGSTRPRSAGPLSRSDGAGGAAAGRAGGGQRSARVHPPEAGDDRGAPLPGRLHPAIFAVYLLQAGAMGLLGSVLGAAARCPDPAGAAARCCAACCHSMSRCEWRRGRCCRECGVGALGGRCSRCCRCSSIRRVAPLAVLRRPFETGSATRPDRWMRRWPPCSLRA